MAAGIELRGIKTVLQATGLFGEFCEECLAAQASSLVKGAIMDEAVVLKVNSTGMERISPGGCG